MAQTIKVSGIPDEMARKLDERWRSQHYADRSEYIRELVRRDLRAASLGDFVQQTFGAALMESEETIDRDVADAIREVRSDRRKRSAA